MSVNAFSGIVVRADTYRLAPEAERFQLPLREIPMLSDYEGCYAQASVSGLSLCMMVWTMAKKARREDGCRDLLQIWSDRVGLRRWQSSEERAMRRGCRVSKVVYACALFKFFSFTGFHCAGCLSRSRICKKSVVACVQSRLLRPSTKRLTLNGFTKRGCRWLSLSSSDRESPRQVPRTFRPKSLVA
jgi:hypothetical protein